MQAFMGIVTAVNCALIGVHTNCRAASLEGVNRPECQSGQVFAFFVSEYVFFFAFVVELVLRLVGIGGEYLWSKWGFFDILCLALSSLGLAFLPPPFVEQFWMQPTSLIRTVCAIRIFRLFRVLRSVNVLMNFSALWTMVTAWSAAASAIGWALLLLCGMIFTFAVVGVESYSSIDPENWSSIGSAMLTLARMATYDDWGALAEPIIGAHPVTGVCFVIPFLCLVPIGFLPVVSAVLTEKSLRAAKNDSDRREIERIELRHRNLGHLEMLLKEADTNDDGLISKEEIRALYESQSLKPQKVKARKYLKELGTLEELDEIFDFIGRSDPRRGAVSRTEFMTSLLRYKQDSRGFVNAMNLQHIASVHRQVVRVECMLEGFRREHRELFIASNEDLAELLETKLLKEERKTKEQDARRAKLLLKKHKMKQVDVAALRDMFAAFDEQWDGRLSKEEFKNVYRLLHGRPAGEEFEQVWIKADPDCSGFLDFDEFIECMCANKWYRKLERSVGNQKQTALEKLRGDKALLEKARRSKDERSQGFANTVAKVAVDSITPCFADCSASAYRAVQQVSGTIEACMNAAVAQAVTEMAAQATKQVAATVQTVAQQAAEQAASLAAQEAAQTLADRVLRELGKLAGDRAAQTTQAFAQDHIPQRLTELVDSTDALRRSVEEKHDTLQSGLIQAMERLRGEAATQRPRTSKSIAQRRGEKATQADHDTMELVQCKVCDTSTQTQQEATSENKSASWWGSSAIFSDSQVYTRIAHNSSRNVSIGSPAPGMQHTELASAVPREMPQRILPSSASDSSPIVPTYMRAGRQVPCFQGGLEAIRVQMAELDQDERRHGAQGA